MSCSKNISKPLLFYRTQVLIGHRFDQNYFVSDVMEMPLVLCPPGSPTCSFDDCAKKCVMFYF